MSADEIASLETEGKIAHAMLLSFTPRPPNLLVESLTEWLRRHITTLASGRNPPRNWQWSWLSFLWVLEQCGIHEVARSDPGMYLDLTGQLEAPAWARNAVPFTQWKRGLPAMPPGRAYAGMNRVSGDPGALLDNFAPPVAAEALDSLLTCCESIRAHNDQQISGDSTSMPPGHQETTTACEVDQDLGPSPNSLGRAAVAQPSNFPPDRNRLDDADEDPTRPKSRGRNLDDGTEPHPRRRRTDGILHTPQGHHYSFTVGRAPRTSRQEQGPSRARVPWQAQVLPPHQMHRGVVADLGIARDSPSSWPHPGRGRVNVPGGPRGEETNSCAISTVAQLTNARLDITLGEFAHCLRKWIGLAPGDFMPIADAWWMVSAHVYGIAAQPRLLVLCTARRDIRDPDVSAITGPGAWDGSYVLAIGTGAHFDPIRWENNRHKTPICPNAISGHYNDRLVLMTDAGAAAALLMGCKIIQVASLRHHPREWEDDISPEVFQEWVRKIQAVLDNQDDSSERPSADWHANCVAVACRFPGGGSRPDDARPALFQLASASFDPRTSQQAAIPWILAIDHDHLHLGRADLCPAIQNVLNAALGRGTL